MFWVASTTFVGLLLAFALGFVIWASIFDGEPVGPRVEAIVIALDKGCQTYRFEYGVYPPGRPDFDSRVLHRCLGSKRRVKKGDGSEVDAPPILQFPQNWLQLKKGQLPDAASPVPIVDPWDHPIRYRNPGIYNKKGVDIWSAGKNGKDEPENPDSDDINNWTREY